MRLMFAMLAMLALAQCATPEDERFRVGESPRALVIIGVAEAPTNTQPRYAMLWRRLEADGGFAAFDDDTAFEARTHMRKSVRVRGVPGEFTMAEVEPGVYALDSVFALIRDRRVDYSANGVIEGPERPSFEVRAGEAVYLGIWELNLQDVTPVARLWRLEQADVDAAMRRSNAAVGPVTPRQAQTRVAPCAPHRLNTRSLREIC
ncbi:MAG TPA: hypothetical protein VEA80_01410 [Vitreimonas sp.]|uniref:hypothetical protein n=1 Tax=Vitreimonas sp. TaxID=3069702 RepID=UPI002D56E70A|nr:hypothetical protein [Vitreimonas sp.]HYD86109.1 hypothetical protein [Vitreimonas sp.]